MDLRRAPLPLRGRAVADGKLLMQNDETAWIDFVTATTGAWFDYRPAYDDAVRIMTAAVLGKIE